MTFGMQVSGLPGRWFTAPATVPQGNVREPLTLDDCTGAYGDSALAEGFGLGAMALSYCPDMKALREGFYGESAFALPEKLLMGSHPSFPASAPWPAFPPGRSLKRARHRSSSSGSSRNRARAAASEPVSIVRRFNPSQTQCKRSNHEEKASQGRLHRCRFHGQPTYRRLSPCLRPGYKVRRRAFPQLGQSGGFRTHITVPSSTISTTCWSKWTYATS